MITIDLHGEPIAKMRPRLGKKFTYDPQKKLKDCCIWQLKSLYRGEAILGPLGLDFIFFMPIPSSTSKLKQRQMDTGLISHTKKPDLDNLLKFYLDCMNGIIFHDDAQVSSIKCKKIYSTKTGTCIRIFPLADADEALNYENCARQILR